jgi:hypothetical protein
MLIRMDRLPILPRSLDNGLVYVVKRGEAYKIGYTRNNLRRRIRACDGVLVLTIPTGQRPAVLETLIHQRFASKRTSGYGFKREWFALDEADINWLRDLATTISSTQKDSSN